MRVAPTLNETRAHTWAAVVSGQAWKAHTLRPFDTPHAEYVRGPLIVWATKPGEGKAGPHLGQPAPSPLEVAAARLNMRPHFLAFVRAARGKVRHSVRWKTGARRRRRRVLKALDRVRYGARLLQQQAEGPRELIDRVASTGERVFKPHKPRPGDGPQKYAVLFRSGKVNIHRFRVYLGLDYETGEVITNRELNEAGAFYREIEGELILSHTYARTLKEALFLFFEWLNGRKRSLRLAFALTVWHLEREAFRAHLARRVKPVSRRTRPPRPLYARSRPPTAPLAPPVI